MNALARTLLGLAALAPTALAAGDLVAIKVGKAETITQGVIEHAVILVDGGKIVTIGQDLPIDRGIPVLDRPEWTAMPGFVNPYSRIGLSDQGGSGSEPHLLASDELYPRDESWEDLLEYGVTTFGLYPPGTGIPGQAVAIRPVGSTVDELVVRDRAYLKIRLSSNPGSKKMLRDGFEDVDKYEEKEEKRREKWEKDQEKKKKKKKSKKDDDDDKDKDDDEGKDDEPTEYVPEEMDEDEKPFAQLRSGELTALVSIRSASDFLHLVDAIDDEEFTWNLRVPLRDDVNIYEVADRIGELEKAIVVEPRLTLHPGTRRLRNLPQELVDAGARVAFIPLSDSPNGHKEWRTKVGDLVRDGFDREQALRAVTIVPAELLRVDDRLGSLEAGKDANIVFLTGDPFEAATRIEAVMLDGRFVHGEVN